MPELRFSSILNCFFGSSSIPFSSAALLERSAALRAARLASRKAPLRLTPYGTCGYGAKVLLTSMGPPCFQLADPRTCRLQAGPDAVDHRLSGGGPLPAGPTAGGSHAGAEAVADWRCEEDAQRSTNERASPTGEADAKAALKSEVAARSGRA
eukprot:CAMPEP_0204218598 /NCGR_PEP_ID=MMETSP0361-20130328/79722_1 /ASSEMBLY_ACC=CAM_ASM_000343 /TAXON_ID=268821 /ORGANISM="Scrippsiella Hangoei, Strain SHTV-5" /LENGTH=152 /DNA_ID=CAMNT_0051183779 /DNA_START=195 /DNA_END=650 /DNA_ORIENTATION=-